MLGREFGDETPTLLPRVQKPTSPESWHETAEL